MKSYVVIGLGRFGLEMAAKLYECGEDVLAIDTDETIIDKFADRVTRAVAADARDIDVLRKLGADSFDRAVVAVGSDLAASALITTGKSWRSWAPTGSSSRSGKWRTSCPWA